MTVETIESRAATCLDALRADGWRVEIRTEWDDHITWSLEIWHHAGPQAGLSTTGSFRDLMGMFLAQVNHGAFDHANGHQRSGYRRLGE